MKLLARTFLSVGSLVLAAFAASNANATHTSAMNIPKGAAEVPAAAHEGEEAEQAELTGVARVVATALQDACLDDTDKIYAQQIVGNLAEQTAAVHEARSNLILALADSLEAGEVCACDLQEEIQAFVAATESAAPYIGAAFSQLHGILDADQRTAVADSLAGGLEAREAGHKSGEWIDKLSKALNLTADQRNAVGNAMGQFDEALAKEREGHAKAIEAFRCDTFMADQAMPPEKISENAQARADRMVALTEALIGILTPEQRKLAADKVRAKIED